ncbi:MAG: flavodoxin family protein [Coriobacteriia bacterium]|nr:flavodoxin family protein [Coriobacteriia bacterium]MCL2746337.1 flavodoxin family protein [Coriobacteriia bacterium]MCL2870259.1 flavodoxin family protein [Coriobacteriia bacterium]
MKVVLFNGSPKQKGTTARALAEIAKELEAADVKTQTLQLGTNPVHGCIACGQCWKNGGTCRYTDDICNELISTAETADGFIFGSPVYFAGANGAMCSILDRAFYASSHFTGKPGAAIVACRRGGGSAAFDRLNKYFTFAQMPVVSSNYWNIAHGNNAAEAEQDLEGLQTMRVLGRNMVQMLKHIEAGKAAGLTMPAPSAEERVWTNFVR